MAMEAETMKAAAHNTILYCADNRSKLANRLSFYSINRYNILRLLVGILLLEM